MVHAQTAGFVAALVPRDRLLPPSSSSGRARRREGKVEVFLGDTRGQGGVRVGRRSEDLYELSFFDGEFRDRGSLFVTGDELAQIEFAGSLESTVEFEDHLPFALVPTERGNLEVQDRRHAIGVRKPVRYPARATLPPVEVTFPMAERVSDVPELRNVSGFESSPAFESPGRTTRWTTQLNPHIRLV